MRFVNQLKITKYTITILLKQLLELKDFKFVKCSNEFERKKNLYKHQQRKNKFLSKKMQIMRLKRKKNKKIKLFLPLMSYLFSI